MSPKKKPAESTFLRVSALAPLLDLPAGVEVTSVQGTYSLGWTLTLTGVDTTEDTIDADYTVDAAGRRTFNTFKPTSESTNPDPTEEKE